MASRLIVPFDNQPVSTQKGTGTYTCPTGKYARVSVSVSGEARSVISGSIASGTNTADPAVSGGEFNQVLDIWVRPGDTVSATLTNASGTSAVGANTVNGGGGTTTVTVNHNGAAIATFRAQTSGSAGNGNGASFTVTRSGTSSFHFFAQEYNVIS